MSRESGSTVSCVRVCLVSRVCGGGLCVECACAARFSCMCGVDVNRNVVTLKTHARFLRRYKATFTVLTPCTVPSRDDRVVRATACMNEQSSKQETASRHARPRKRSTSGTLTCKGPRKYTGRVAGRSHARLPHMKSKSWQQGSHRP